MAVAPMIFIKEQFKNSDKTAATAHNRHISFHAEFYIFESTKKVLYVMLG